MPSNHPLIESRQQEVIEDFSVFDDWMDKYEHLIDLGKDVPTIDDARKTDEHLIKGCQSRVWLAADETEDGGVVFTADSDAIITKGLVGLMVGFFPMRPPKPLLKPTCTFSMPSVCISTFRPRGPTDWPAWFNRCGFMPPLLPPGNLNFTPCLLSKTLSRS